jgi:hypothetical protein
MTLRNSAWNANGKRSLIGIALLSEAFMQPVQTRMPSKLPGGGFASDLGPVRLPLPTMYFGSMNYARVVHAHR